VKGGTIDHRKDTNKPRVRGQRAAKPTHVSQECLQHFSRADLEARLRWMAGHYARAHAQGTFARKKRRSASKAKAKKEITTSAAATGKKNLPRVNSTESPRY